MSSTFFPSLALDVLGLFAKHWTPGQAKTRIAVKTGPAVASQLAQWLLASAAEEFRTVADQRWLLYAPPEKKVEFERLPCACSWRLHPQAAGDLGARLSDFFRAAFAAGARRVVAIGADCPGLSAAICSNAFEELERHDTVIGPATDGGYYLIGLRKPTVSIFEEIPWSTSAARERTMQRIDAAGLSVWQLPELTDLDEVESLPLIEAELKRRTSLEADQKAAVLRVLLSGSGEAAG